MTLTQPAERVSIANKEFSWMTNTTNLTTCTCSIRTSSRSRLFLSGYVSSAASSRHGCATDEERLKASSDKEFDKGAKPLCGIIITSCYMRNGKCFLPRIWSYYTSSFVHPILTEFEHVGGMAAVPITSSLMLHADMTFCIIFCHHHLLHEKLPVGGVKKWNWGQVET